MKVVTTISELKTILELERKRHSIGFVPTMGALHKGHISLVNKCASEKKFVVVSIFVNPTQFNDKDDLKRYPRNLEKDCNLLENDGCNLVFAPSVEEIYPVPDTRKFNFGSLESVMEGRHRPGHFNGVGQVVSKLFDSVEPETAYFGLKDFQQLAIINKLVTDYNYPIKIVPCPIVRETDGLAMSSRNELLEPAKRAAAPFIYKTLKSLLSLKTTNTPSQLINYVQSEFLKNKELELEYIEIVDNNTLLPINIFSDDISCTACIAAYAGKIRLIDNIQF